MKFSKTKAIVKKPANSLPAGLSSANLGKPDYRQALKQHRRYIEALENCAVEVFVLAADERFPDSVFVEDCAVLTERFALIARPGAPSRRGEEEAVEEALREFYTDIEHIKAPGTLDGGDVMQVGHHFYIGLSARTNLSGADQLIEILGNWGYSGTVIELEDVLHLKTGVAYLGSNHLLVAGEFIAHPAFEEFDRIVIEESESYAANCIRVNDALIMPAGFPKSKHSVEAAGYRVLEVDVSEFRKLDGGVSCLSLRF